MECGGRSSSLSNFLAPEINLAPIPGVISPHGYGQLINCGRIDTAALLKDIKSQSELILAETRFDFTSLKHLDAGINIKILKLTISYFVKGMMVKTHF